MKKANTNRTRKNKNDNANTANTSALKEGAQIEKDQQDTTAKQRKTRTTRTTKIEAIVETSQVEKKQEVAIDLVALLQEVDNEKARQKLEFDATTVTTTAYNSAKAEGLAKIIFDDPADYIASDGKPAKTNAATMIYNLCECGSDRGWTLALLKVASSIKLLTCNAPINVENETQAQTQALRIECVRMLRSKASQLQSTGYVDGTLSRIMDTEVVQTVENQRLARVCVAIAVLNGYIEKGYAEKPKCTDMRAWVANFFAHTGLEPFDLTQDEQRWLAQLKSDCRLKSLEAFMFALLRNRSLSWIGVRAVVARLKGMAK